MKQNKNPRFLLVDQEIYLRLNLKSCPNFHQSGDIEGMRNKYYGKDAFLLQCDEYIYHVNQDVFEAAKDIQYLNSLPEWVKLLSANLTKSDMDSYSDRYFKSRLHENEAERGRQLQEGNDEAVSRLDDARKEILAERAVVSFAFQSDCAKQLVTRIQEGLSDVRLLSPATGGAQHVSCSIDGERQPAFRLTEAQRKSIANLPPSQLQDALHYIAAYYHSDRLFFQAEEIKQGWSR